MSDATTPTNLHLKKTEALEITWADNHHSVLPLRFLRKHCPCAGCKGERDLLGRTRLAIVQTTYDGPITASGAELVGNYALRIDFSDGHSTGIYTFEYLRELDSCLKSEASSQKSEDPENF
ncbi:MAG TPA: DUF971 domain-containing protein [Phycisphaerae bacterium]|nr:DUF971 domain-containing protein [Phycisphaerae bacterium]